MSAKKNYSLSVLFCLLVLFGLYLTSLHSYLLFHSLAELLGIVVACGIFMVALNARGFLDNGYFLFIGIAYLFVAGLDLIHTLAYSGMGVFPGYGTNLPTQLWIAARYVESISLLIAPLFLDRKLNIRIASLILAVVFALVLVSIFSWKAFPDCFVDGVGLTPFKKTSEYIIAAILAGSIGILVRKRKAFDTVVIRLLIGSLLLTICSELAFTFYVHAYGFSNLMGHFFKIVSFFLIYKAIIQTGLAKPYALLFRSLKQGEKILEYRLAFEDLISNISTRFITLTSEEIDQAVDRALEKIGTFAGADGGYVFQFSDDMKSLGMTHLWRNQNLRTRKSNLQDLDPNSMPWWMEKLRNQEPVVVSSVSHLPAGAAMEKGILEPQGVKSLVDVPMIYLGKVVGFLGFSCVQAPRHWTDDEIHLLKMIGQVITNALSRKDAEQRVSRAKKEWEQTFDAMPDLITLLDQEQRIVRANKALAEKLGSSPEALIGRRCYEVFHGTETPPAFCPHVRLLNDHGVHTEEVHEAQLGGDFLVSVSPLYDRDGRLSGSVHVARDITHRKEAERALRRAHNGLEKRVQERTAELKRVSAQLLTVEEDERKRISRELHDSIGQSLAAIKFGVEGGIEQILNGATKAGVESLEAIIPVVKQASEEVRRIHTDLRPSMLDDLGILKTISWFSREFGKLYPNLSIEQGLDIQEDEVPEPVKIVIFRVLQEALNNVVKYADAELVHISLKRTAGGVELLVADKGKGFDIDQVQAKRSLTGGFGLHSMKERAELSGGSLSIKSGEGAGTTIRVFWPY